MPHVAAPATLPIRFTARPIRADITEIAVLIGDSRLTLDDWLDLPAGTELHESKRRPEVIDTALQDS